MDITNFVIESETIKQVPISLQYKEEMFKEFTREITLYMTPQPAKDISETEEFIRSSREKNEQGSNMQMVILEKKTDEFLGCAGLHGIDTPTPELGLRIKESAHGHGYGKEAITALKQRADKNLSYEYILYPVDKENFASRRIPESLGGVVSREYKIDNADGSRELDILEYRIFKV